jgi:hypothetical protein
METASRATDEATLSSASGLADTQLFVRCLPDPEKGVQGEQ